MIPTQQERDEQIETICNDLINRLGFEEQLLTTADRPQLNLSTRVAIGKLQMTAIRLINKNYYASKKKPSIFEPMTSILMLSLAWFTAFYAFIS